MIALFNSEGVKFMMEKVKAQLLLPLPWWVMPISFIFSGLIFVVIGLSPVFAEYMSRKEPIPIVIRALLIFSGIALINPVVVQLSRIASGQVDLMAEAIVPGLLFPGGVLFHIVFQHWLGSFFSFFIGAKPKVFAALGKALIKLRVRG